MFDSEYASVSQAQNLLSYIKTDFFIENSYLEIGINISKSINICTFNLILVQSHIL